MTQAYPNLTEQPSSTVKRMKSSSLRIRLALVFLVLFSSILTACTLSVAGGLSGVGISVALLLLFLAGTTATQTGCDTTPCLSVTFNNEKNEYDDRYDTNNTDTGDTSDTDETSDTNEQNDTENDAQDDAEDDTDQQDTDDLEDTSDADDQDAEDTELGALRPKPALPTHITDDRTRILAKIGDRLPSDVLAKITPKTNLNVEKKA